MAQKTDKTKDEVYFILSLAAIGKEVSADMEIMSGIHHTDYIEVVLLVGLPPLHCREMGERFSRYFMEHGRCVRFVYNGLPISINIVDVHVYPQAYAAAITVLDRIRDVRTVSVVDMGGYTVDLLKLTNLRPDMSVCTSLYYGVNTLFQKINEQVRAKGKNNIPDTVIENILLSDAKVLNDTSQERIELVRTTAELFTREMLHEISQAGIDLLENRTVFVGGGSILLKGYIEKADMVAKPLFVDNVHANAEGYQLLYNNRKSAQTQGV